MWFKNYIVDFYCPELKLAIEVDGYQHFLPENIEYDNKRTAYIEEQGIYVLRFENTEVNKDIEYVRYIINNVCDARQKGAPIVPEYRWVDGWMESGDSRHCVSATLHHPTDIVFIGR